MRDILELLILAYAVFLNRFLLVDWLRTLGDLSWLAFLIWCIPLLLNRTLFKDSLRSHPLYYFAALAILIAGDSLHIKFFTFAGLIACLVIESRIPPIPGSIWIISSLSWSAFAGYLAFESLAFFRVLVATIGVLSLIPFFWKLRYNKKSV